MEIRDVVEYINAREDPELTPEMDVLVMQTCYRTHQLTMELNTSYHDPDGVRGLLKEITGEEIDESVNMFPPFYTDFGRNIHFGRNVFVNACCHFQDQGGIFLPSLASFLRIGLFHPVVIWCEYRFSWRAWPVFLALGLAFLGVSLCLANVIASAVLGVVGFSCLWSVVELFEQHKRVEKGWFPANPKHHPGREEV